MQVAKGRRQKGHFSLRRALAGEIERECAKGLHDARKAKRLARAVLMFQERLSPGVRDSQPPMAASAIGPEPETRSEDG